ncbi:MAG TPA: phasin family protein [Xanthobacteraceae bacterium]|jgi:phasin family protein
MADARHAEKGMSEAAEETRKAADRTSRATRVATDAGADVARAGADIFQRSGETIQQMWESGTRIAGQLAEQSMRGWASAFGASEGAQHATELAARNLTSISRSGTALANGFQMISREMMEFGRKRLEQNLQRVDALAKCRTPHELVEAQTDFIRDNLEDLVHSTRRLAEVSMQMADEASRSMKDASLAPR